eukprot:155691-Amphidinium_carterae.1
MALECWPFCAWDGLYSWLVGLLAFPVSGHVARVRTSPDLYLQHVSARQSGARAAGIGPN